MRKRSARAVSVPVAAAGERVWLLDMPYGVRFAEARWVPQWRAHAFVGAQLSPALTPFAARPFSYQRWLEDDLNAEQLPAAGAAVPRLPRPQQVSGAAAIVAAATSGARQFLLADAPGTGKTITLILAAAEIARARAVRRRPQVLVTVDRPASITVAHWRASIAGLTDAVAAARWLIISPDQLPKLLATNGKPRFSFDVVILDEAHLYRHVDTKRVRAMRRIAGYAGPHSGAPFVIAATATPSHHPAELTYLGPVLAQVHGETPGRWADVGARMAEAGLPLQARYGRWTWSPEAMGSVALQQQWTKHVRGWLVDRQPPLMLHRAADWGEPPLEPMPATLDPAERARYALQWRHFQQEMGLARQGRSVAKGRAAVMRFRQKAGLIRVPHTVAWVLGQVAAGRQVVVSAEFVSTAAQPIAEALVANGIRVARIYGTGAAGVDVEEERLAFQRGAADVCVFTVTSSISLHANELLADGSAASGAPRVGVLHQPGYSGIAARQRLGRIHRDGQVGEWWLAYAEDTVEQDVASVLMARLMATTDLVGADLAGLESIAAMLGADWLDRDALVGS